MLKRAPAKTACYEIRVMGVLEQPWTSWFEPLSITYDRNDQQPVTILTCHAADQAFLRGLMNKIWDFNLTLISIQRMDHLEAETGPKGV